MKEILIVEDNPLEATFALEKARLFGLKGILAGDFGSAIQELERKPDYLLSDLFFPSGDIEVSQYLEKIIPFYENYLSLFRKKERGVGWEALKVCSGVLDISPERFIDEILPVLGTPKRDISRFKDEVYQIQDYERHQKVSKLIEDMKQGTEYLPYGVFLTDKANELNIPSRIITSVNHHEISFGPIESLLNVKYFSETKEGKKRWEDGLKSLLNGGGVD